MRRARLSGSCLCDGEHSLQQEGHAVVAGDGGGVGEIDGANQNDFIALHTISMIMMIEVLKLDPIFVGVDLIDDNPMLGHMCALFPAKLPLKFSPISGFAAISLPFLRTLPSMVYSFWSSV